MRSAPRALLPISLQIAPPALHAACNAAARHSRHVPRIACSPCDSRQFASAFNQPLSFDTSSVTDMGYMFMVCPWPALPPICSRALPCTLRAPRSPAPSGIPARTSPRIACALVSTLGRPRMRSTSR